MEDTLAAPGSPVEPLANSQKAFAGCKGVEVDRALQAEAKFTVPLLDRIPKVLHLNIWREIIRREHGLHLVG